MVTTARAVRIGGWAAVALTAALTLGACGAAEDGGGPAGDAAGTATAAASGDTLLISADDGTGQVTEWTLTCADPAGGTHPDPAAACAALAANQKSLTPVAADAVCTMQYGGDDTATVTGSYEGEKVDASFSLNGGCEIDRWASLVPLLPAAEGMTGNPLASSS